LKIIRFLLISCCIVHLTAHEPIKQLIHLEQQLHNQTSDKKDLAQQLLNLGMTFFDAHKADFAIRAFTDILTLFPQAAAAHHNIGFTLSEKLGNYAESLSHYEQALQYKPHDPATRFCYAISLLATGNLLQGFNEYEWRWHRGARNPRNLSWPLARIWDGSDLQNKKIIMLAEQGLGDVMQFIRFGQELKKCGAYVIAEVHKPLLHILARCPFIDELIPVGTPFPPHDYKIPYLCIPRICQTQVKTIPTNIPYIFADTRLVTHWKKQFDHKTINIGICWHGDPAHGSGKFMPLKYFVQLAQIPRVKLYSLQRINGLDQITQDAPITLFDESFDTKHGSFMDTAAVMKCLDVIITVDTSVAHLAGALGVPVWVVLPFPAEWRWLQNRSDSPWYPTMRLFRQQKVGEWQPIIDEIKKAVCTKF